MAKNSRSACKRRRVLRPASAPAAFDQAAELHRFALAEVEKLPDLQQQRIAEHRREIREKIEGPQGEAYAAALILEMAIVAQHASEEYPDERCPNPAPSRRSANRR